MLLIIINLTLNKLNINTSSCSVQRKTSDPFYFFPQIYAFSGGFLKNWGLFCDQDPPKNRKISPQKSGEFPQEMQCTIWFPEPETSNLNPKTQTSNLKPYVWGWWPKYHKISRFLVIFSDIWWYLMIYVYIYIYIYTYMYICIYRICIRYH